MEHEEIVGVADDAIERAREAGLGPFRTAEAAVAVVEPLIRADEREQIARRIKAEADMDRHAYWTEDLIQAAAIAREVRDGA